MRKVSYTRPLPLLLALAGILLSTCTREDAASSELKGFLSMKYGLTAQEHEIYCFFPANQCKNCFLYHARHVQPEINAHTHIITGFDSSNFKGFRHVLRDPDNDMLGLRALDYGNRIVTFRDGRIHGIVVVRDLYAQLDSTWLSLYKP